MSDLSDDTKLNCAGEFLTACEDEYEISNSVEVLSVLRNFEPRFEYVSNLAEALTYACEQVENSGDIQTILDFAHTYLAKAYEKKVGRA
jgi:endonuclease IV